MNSQYGVQICTISEQPDPNFFSIYEPSYRPKVVYLIITQKMERDGYADCFVKAISSFVRVERRMIDDENSPSCIQTLYDRIYEEIKKDPETAEEKILVNITGGTKLLAIGAVRASEKYAIDYVYFSLDKNKFLRFTASTEKAEGKTEKISEDELNLNLRGVWVERYLAAHGVEVAEKNGEFLEFWDLPTEAQNKFIEYALKKNDEPAFRKALHEINNLKQGPKGMGPLTKIVHIPNDFTSEEREVFQNTLNAIKLFGLAKGRDKLITFPNKTGEEFFQGRWFEQYTASQLMALAMPYPMAIRPFNLKFHQSTVQTEGTTPIHNEIDAVFFHRNKLHVIEVKSGAAGTQGSGAQSMLFKVRQVSENVGGKGSKRLIVSLLEPTPNYLQRAAETGVRVLYGKEVTTPNIMREKLKEWINSRD